MTMRQNILNELNLNDGVSTSALCLCMNVKNKTIAPRLSELVKEGRIERSEDGAIFITDKGKKEIEPATSNAPSKPINKSDIPLKIEEQTPETAKASPTLDEQFNRLKLKLEPLPQPKNITLKSEVCERLSELLSDDIRELLLDISYDYKVMENS